MKICCAKNPCFCTGGWQIHQEKTLLWHGGVGCNDIMPIFGLGIRKLAHIIAMDTNKKYAVGVDIGGSHITSA